MDDSPLILVVDDEPDNFAVLEIFLAQLPYRLIHALTANQAFSLLAEHTVDLILMDVMLPGMDGLEATRRIKADVNWRPIPVIVVTALASKDDLARCLEAGADDFIAKPVNSLELRARMRAMLRLKQQYDQLQLLATLRDDLSHMVVHDLRGPLTSITMSASVLERLCLDEKPQRQVRRIHASVQRLECMVDSILMLAKLEAGKLELQRQPQDLVALLQEALEDLQGIFEQHHIQLERHLPDSPLVLSLDSTLIRRVIDNLLSNAVKFSPAGSSIQVRVEALTDGGGLFEIADTGTGVSEPLKERLFEKFEVGPLSDQQARQLQGVTQTGLGLAFCKMAVDAHGGTIEVSGNQPQGAVFRVRL